MQTIKLKCRKHLKLVDYDSCEKCFNNGGSGYSKWKNCKDFNLEIQFIEDLAKKVKENE